MEYVVTTKGNRQIRYTPPTLVDTLVARVSKDKSAHTNTHGDAAYAVLQGLIDLLMVKGSMAGLPLRILMHLSFSLGYYYRMFLEKNNVTIEGESDDSDSNQTSLFDTTEQKGDQQDD